MTTAVFDLHDQAYYVWRDAGVRKEVLVHVDAHHDTAPMESWSAIDIGNYVRAAIREEVVAAVHWIVPDAMWSDAATRAILVRTLRRIADRRLSTVAQSAKVGGTVEGVELWMGPLSGMPRIAAPVLLDIDVDYFVTLRYQKDRSAEPEAVPWCWPDDLVTRLRASGVTPLVTTIATSVTGGFTPLRWAHLAREIAARLDGESSSPFLSCCALLRAAAECRDGSQAVRAIAACRDAVTACPAEPAAHLHLAERLQAAGQLDEARAAYRRSRALDPAYAHAFRSRGPYLYRRKRLTEAEAAYQEALALDPEDAHARAGLAMVAFRQGRSAVARDLAEQSLAADPGSVDAWRTLAAARAELGQPAAAIEAYEHAMTLSLRGAAPLGGPWSSNPDRRLIDPRHWSDHAAAGDLHTRLGAMDAAAAHYRIAAAGGLGRTSDGVLPS